MRFRILILALLLLTPAWGQGQDMPSVTGPSEYEVNFSRSLWFSSENAAGMAITPLDNYSILSVSHKHEEGDFKSVQHGYRESLTSFNTNGAVRLGKTYLWGDFSFKRDYWKDAQYNTNMFYLDPDMPYYVVDDRVGDWNKQSYDMSVKAAFPIAWNRVIFGAQASYLAYKGAKQIDPRGVPIGYALEASPSVAVLLGKGHSIGAAFTYRNTFMRNTFSNVQGTSSNIVFLMKGLGFYSSGTVSGTGGVGVYFYPGNKFGGSLQYSYISENISLMTDLGYYAYKQDAYQDPSTRQRMGTADKTGYVAEFQLMWGENVRHKVSLEAEYTLTDGIEYLQERSSTSATDPYITLAELYLSTYVGRAAALEYNLYIRGGVSSYSWNTGLCADYKGRSETYLTPYSINDYDNAYAGLFVKKNIQAGNICKILLGLDGGYRLNLGGEYDYNGSTPEHRVITVFYTGEHHFNTTDYIKAGADAGISIALKGKTSIGLNLGYDAFIPAADYDIRWCATAALSLMF